MNYPLRRISRVAGLNIVTAACIFAANEPKPAPVAGLAQLELGSQRRGQEAFFEQKVRPLLADKCFSCHSVNSGKQKGGLLLDSRDAILKGGESGPAAAEGKPDQSLMIRAVQYHEPDLQMPPKEKLSSKEVATLAEWILGGLHFPSPHTNVGVKRKVDLAEGRKFWAFQPLTRSNPPVIQSDGHVRSQGRIDDYIFGKLAQHSIAPSTEAPKVTLLRRAKFDLVGLPPTPDEVREFIADSDPRAYERRIDAWLASPQYGERWARHWLDLARYCDVGESWMDSKGQSHPYRDWVIAALNADVPFDRFSKLQLAADLLPETRPADRAALGFLGLSPTYWKELQLPVEIIKTIVSDEYEERVHTLSSVFFGVNLACARCHDHKYDPFTSEDYYGIAGVFASTRTAEHSLSGEINGQHAAQLKRDAAKLEEDIKKLKAKKGEDQAQKIAELEDSLAKINSNSAYSAQLVSGVREGSLKVEPAVGKHGSRIVYDDSPQDMALEVRGNPNRTAQIVARRFPAVFEKDGPLRFSHGSGRRELADALFTHSRDLVARVIVNRIWAAHFGAGIVGTPSDFGVQGERPTHPELLDDLAARFVQNGWSFKWLHREIMTSATYRQDSGAPPAADPELKLHSRFRRKRLDVEQWRDALLCASGQLDPKMGGAPFDLGALNDNRRTIYGSVKRRELSDILRLHDFPDPVTHSPARIPTTTPLQQLFTLNSPLMIEQSLAMARRLSMECPESVARVERAYLLLFGRQPNPGEIRLALEYVGSGEESVWQRYCQALMGSNEFLFID
jgi:hypothetical protein